MIRVTLPQHLQTLARTGMEIRIEIEGPATLGALLDAIEQRYPMLNGTIRDHVTQQRRPMIRFFACSQDLSLLANDTPLPTAITSGAAAFMIIGAIAGGQV